LRLRLRNIGENESEKSFKKLNLVYGIITLGSEFKDLKRVKLLYTRLTYDDEICLYTVKKDLQISINNVTNGRWSHVTYNASLR
jgi:hypothetical protein